MSQAQLTPLSGSSLKIGDSQFCELIAERLLSEAFNPIEINSINEISATISILPLLEKSDFHPLLSSPDLITRISSTYIGVSVSAGVGWGSLLIDADNDGVICGAIWFEIWGTIFSAPEATDHDEATGARSCDAEGVTSFDAVWSAVSVGTSFSSVTSRLRGFSNV
ncbi:hypothetical protein OGAPHI_001600 [Ogataea philodendri]|uniref:Uncharacterized protein n=1 Tax=Ogataea philodendri TaxID=1378263 RepID=A0A9P8PDW2_9ASCO|nr:uncharacterized protein OGAPHI_001600 [Ogataea philodendri]KAH3669479.1 hypothetical protein OGAPHI_001600 [Ogataea philodendri]